MRTDTSAPGGSSSRPADPTAFAVSSDGAEIAAAVAKFEELVDGLFHRPGRGVSPEKRRARR